MTQLANQPVETTKAQTHHVRATCRACGHGNLRFYLRLGPTPLANSFLTSQSEFSDEQSFPLDVYFCEYCSLSQLVDVVDPEIMFRHYVYTTGTSDTIARHNLEYSDTLVTLQALGPEDLVVEVASNDGSLLKAFQRYGVRTLGIEPALNIAKMARAAGIDTIAEFFTPAVARQVRQDFGPARVITANNVLAHVDEPRDFLSGMKHLLTEDGIAVLEFPYAGEYLDRLEYDTVYHEHLSYFTVTSLMHLFERAGLALTRIDRKQVHGGSLRIYAGHAEVHGGHAASVREIADREARSGVTDFARYREFALKVERNRAALLKLLDDLKREGRTLAGYGAPAKGNTLLNYCGITSDLLPYTVDKNPLKVETWAPGSHVPVLPVDTLLKRQPDYVLILAWNFADEIMSQQSEYKNRGGRFIIPIPEPHIL